jgi:hypothetical protein
MINGTPHGFAKFVPPMPVMFGVSTVDFNPRHSVPRFSMGRAKMALAGLSPGQMAESMKAAYVKKELPPVEPSAMSFMMSKQA